MTMRVFTMRCATCVASTVSWIGAACARDGVAKSTANAITATKRNADLCIFSTPSFNFFGEAWTDGEVRANDNRRKFSSEFGFFENGIVDGLVVLDGLDASEDGAGGVRLYE